MNKEEGIEKACRGKQEKAGRYLINSGSHSHCGFIDHHLPRALKLSDLREQIHGPKFSSKAVFSQNHTGLAGGMAIQSLQAGPAKAAEFVCSFKQCTAKSFCINFPDFGAIREEFIHFVMTMNIVSQWSEKIV